MNDDMDMRPRVGFEESLCSPTDVLARLLSLIAPDGSVCLSYDSGSSDPFWETVPPQPSFALDGLAEQVYAVHLIRVARLLFQVCQRMNTQRLLDTDPVLRIAALTLTAYLHDPAFLHQALELIQPNEQGDWTQPPRLPEPNISAN